MRRRVRFSNEEFVCCVETHSEFSNMERTAAWWSGNDIYWMKRKVEKDLRLSRRALIAKAYKQCLNGGEDTVNDEENSAISSKSVTMATELLKEWVATRDRGLEPWSSIYISRNRELSRSNQLKGIKSIQQLKTKVHVEDIDEKIRITSEKWSRTARKFALAMGEADAAMEASDDARRKLTTIGFTLKAAVKFMKVFKLQKTNNIRRAVDQGTKKI